MFWIMRGSLTAGDNFWCLKSYGRQREGSICHMSLLYARRARQTRTNTETLPKVWDFIIPRRFSWCCVINILVYRPPGLTERRYQLNFLTCFFKISRLKSVCKEPPPRPDSWMPRHGRAVWRRAKNPPYLPRPTYLFIQGATDPLHLSPLQGSTMLEPKLAHAPQHVGVLTASRRVS